MPQSTPFHAKTLPLCTSYRWKDWAGYHAVCSYDTSHDREYFAFRHGSGIIDLTPLFKYKVTGKDAALFLSHVMTRDIEKLASNRVTYTAWCDDEGFLIDDGTVMNFGNNVFHVTAAIPSLSWFERFNRGYDAKIEDISDDYAILGVQGPTSRDLLRAVLDHAAIDGLKFFKFTETNVDNIPIVLSRTGYTGDLGYEIWVDSIHAEKLWDMIFKKAPLFGGEACGLDALDVVRIEAGFIMNGVDYNSAHHCAIKDRKSTPYEAGIGWTVDLKKPYFNGHQALRKEQASGPKFVTMGIEYNWTEYEEMFERLGLPPDICGNAWRTSVPLYDAMKRQIGYASSGTWSPLLKKNIAICRIKSTHAKPGTQIKVEVTVEHERRAVSATVVTTPFFNPERKTK